MNRIAKRMEAMFDIKFNDEKNEFLEECRKVFDLHAYNHIERGLAHGLSIDEIKIYADPKNPNKFNAKQMWEILVGFYNNLTREQINLYAKPEFDAEEMSIIESAFSEKDLTIEQVKLFAKPEFNADQMWAIRKGLTKGLSINEVALYAKPNISAVIMNSISRQLMNGMPIEEVKERYNL